MINFKACSKFVVVGALACGVAAASAAESEHGLPKTITIVVPFNPGASNDTFARALAQVLGPQIGSSIIVENKPGAGGIIGAGYVSRAPKDGATLLLTSSSFATAAAVHKSLPYDPDKSFAPVAMLAQAPMLITVGAQTPYQSAADLIADARAHGGKINYASAGIGSINHMSGELIDSMAKVKMVHVPYKGAASALTDLMAGQVQMMVASPSSALGPVQSGKVRVLAVTSPKPSSLVPGVPPLAETVPGYSVEIWWGIFAPAGTPRPVVDRLNAEIRKAIDTPQMRERFSHEGAQPSTTVTAEQFTESVHQDLVKWRTIAQQKHITAD